MEYLQSMIIIVKGNEKKRLVKSFKRILNGGKVAVTVVVLSLKVQENGLDKIIKRLSIKRRVK